MLLFCLLISMQSCRHEKTPNKQVSVIKEIDLNTLKIKKLIFPKEFKLKKNINYNYFVTIVFDGNCSFCIKHFLEILKKVKSYKSKQKIKYVFISYSQDLYSIENYLEEYHLNLSKDEVLIRDFERVFNKENNFASGDPINIILSKTEGEIISTVNPFNDSEVMRKYVDLGIFIP